MLFHVSDLGPQLVARRISNKSTAVGWTVNLAGQGVLWSNSGQVYIFLQQAPGFPPTANVLWGINESGDSCGNQDKYVGTRPVPPHGLQGQREWELLDANERDAILSILLLRAADLLDDEASRREQRQTAGVALGRALSRMTRS